MSTQVRLLVRGVDFDLLFPPLVVVLPCILVLVLVGLYQWRTISLPYAIFTVILASIVMAAAIRVISYNEETFTDGARHIASRVFADPTVSKLFVVHAGLPHDSLTPRLAYYTQGWTSGWQEGRSVTKHTWYSPELVGELAQLPPKSAVILEREQDRFSRPSAEFIERYDSAVLILEQRFTERDSLRSYDLFYDR